MPTIPSQGEARAKIAARVALVPANPTSVPGVVLAEPGLVPRNDSGPVLGSRMIRLPRRAAAQIFLHHTGGEQPGHLFFAEAILQEHFGGVFA